MTTRTTKLILTTTDERLPSLAVWKNNRERAASVTAAFLEALVAGQTRGTLEVTRDDGDAVAASGTVTLSGASGTVGATINGVSITVAFDTDDHTTAQLLVDTINASVNALVQPFVTATYDYVGTDGIVVVTAKTKGVAGNTITLAASGTGALASGARLTGGADATAAGKATLDI